MGLGSGPREGGLHRQAAHLKSGLLFWHVPEAHVGGRRRPLWPITPSWCWPWAAQEDGRCSRGGVCLDIINISNHRLPSLPHSQQASLRRSYKKANRASFLSHLIPCNSLPSLQQPSLPTPVLEPPPPALRQLDCGASCPLTLLKPRPRPLCCIAREGHATRRTPAQGRTEALSPAEQTLSPRCPGHRARRGESGCWERAWTAVPR